MWVEQTQIKFIFLSFAVGVNLTKIFFTQEVKEDVS